MRKGFLLDLDGVITDTANDHFAAWRDLASGLGIEIDEEFNQQLKGVGRMDSLERILVHGGRENDFSPEQKKELAAKKNRKYRQMLKYLSSKDLLPGALKFLKDARKAGVACCMVSASRNSDYIIERLGVRELFDAVINPALIKKSKPDPEIFIEGAKMLHLNPIECIGFEDAQAGIDAIKRAGMFAVGIETGNYLKGADLTVRSLEELSVEELIEV